MPYQSICISAGHGEHVPGACGILLEHEEACRVVEHLADELSSRGVDVVTFVDTKSTSQSQNLDAIVAAHNNSGCEFNLSIHFNAYEQVSKPMGTEMLYLTQSQLAAELSAAVASCGFINRGAKKRTDLRFLNSTQGPAVLAEICFVDSEADANLYAIMFDQICAVMAQVLAGEDVAPGPLPPPEEEVSDSKVYRGKVSYFGGPDDLGVSASEGLAFIYHIEDAPHLFLPTQPTGTTGLARRLNGYTHYLAMRFDYSVHPKDTLLGEIALVRAVRTGIELEAMPADWGPHESTGRIADLSPSLMHDLGIETDDEVEITFPYRPA
jgi:hypothetical protein